MKNLLCLKNSFRKSEQKIVGKTDKKTGENDSVNKYVSY